MEAGRSVVAGDRSEAIAGSVADMCTGIAVIAGGADIAAGAEAASISAHLTSSIARTATAGAVGCGARQSGPVAATGGAAIVVACATITELT